MPRVFAAILAVGLFIYAFTDCVQATRTAYLTKPVWLLVKQSIFAPLAL